mgnify:CR=1 FL=1
MKYKYEAQDQGENPSLPSWERGLKYVDFEIMKKGVPVAPLVGAWIEIWANLQTYLDKIRRSPRGSVD